MNYPQSKLARFSFFTILCLLLFPAFKIAANPFIEITTPTNGSTYIEGDTIKINATASNIGGASIQAVEFYINNVYIGKDTSAPYQFNWIGVEGTHLITVREDHGYCYKTSSVPVQIIVKKNIAPVVQLTQPANASIHFNPLPVEIAATATDTDGTINRVDFFVNSIYIASDYTAPYKVSWPSIPGAYTITVKAIDNKSSQTTSTPITITVYPAVNSAPTVSITSPANGDYFTLGNPIIIKANAADADGVVSSVEFFANNTSIGMDATAPYETSWSGIAGLVTLTAKVTDNNCAITTSDSVHISIIDPNAPHYVIQNGSGQCSDPTFCLPVKAIFPVKDVIGYDVVLHYDKTKVHPTGNISINNDLINSGYVSYAVNTIDSLGEINISVFLNNTSPTGTSFHGLGQVFCAEFSKESGFAANDTAFFTITDFQESYANGVTMKQVTAGHYLNLKNTIYKGALKFWKDNSPIKYDVLTPSQYLITNVYGTDSNCANKSAVSAKPDLNGKFQYNISNGTSMQVERDILPSTNVQPVINGMDVNLGYSVLLNDALFVPSVYQLIALDVNLDGVVSAGDMSQLNQRSIKTILEFKQKWNYSNNGNSNGQLSKDWLFVDTNLLASPAYKISTTYPSNDGIGYSKYRVPVVPFCLPIPSSVCNSCVTYTEGTLKGVLLGDVNGNYESIAPDGQIKRTTESNKGMVYLDLTKAKSNSGHTDVPVYFSSSEKIVALDFSVKLDESVNFIKLTNAASYTNDAMANVDEEHTLRFTSNGRKNYETDKPVVTLRFEGNTINTSDLTELTGYLNGEPVSFEIRNNILSGINNSTEIKDVQIYPNPASGILNVVVTETSSIQLLDIQGKEVLIETRAIADEKLEIHVNDLKGGVYLLKVINEHFVNSQQVVIEGK